MLIHILLVLVVSTLWAVGVSSAFRLVRDTCTDPGIKNGRLSFAIGVMCFLIWWQVLFAFAAIYGMQIAELKFKARPLTQQPKKLRSGAELELYS